MMDLSLRILLYQMVILSLVKLMPLKNNSEYKYRDSSINIRNNEEGYIDDNYVDTNGDGYKFSKVRIRSSYSKYR